MSFRLCLRLFLLRKPISPVTYQLKETGTQLEQSFCFGLLSTVLRSESTNNSYISLISPRDIHMTMPRDTQRVQSKVGYSSFTRNHVALRSPSINRTRMEENLYPTDSQTKKLGVEQLTWVFWMVCRDSTISSSPWLVPLQHSYQFL